MSADISRLLCPPRDISLQRNKKACAKDDWGRGGGVICCWRVLCSCRNYVCMAPSGPGQQRREMSLGVFDTHQELGPTGEFYTLTFS